MPRGCAARHDKSWRAARGERRPTRASRGPIQDGRAGLRLSTGFCIKSSVRIKSHLKNAGSAIGGVKQLSGGRMASDLILEVTDANFDQDVLKSDKPVMVDFWAAWCGPCRALAPVVDEVASQFQGKVKVAKMDVDKNVATPQRYNVRGIPTLLIFKGGQV